MAAKGPTAPQMWHFWFVSLQIFMKQKLLRHYVYSARVVSSAPQPQSSCSSGTIRSTCPVPQVEPIIWGWEAIRGGACQHLQGRVGWCLSWACWFCARFVRRQIHLFTTCFHVIGGRLLASVDPAAPVRTLNYLSVLVCFTSLILSSSLNSECPDGFSVGINILN